MASGSLRNLVYTVCAARASAGPCAGSSRGFPFRPAEPRCAGQEGPHAFLRRRPRPLGLLTPGAPRGSVSLWTPLSRLSCILPLFLSLSSPPPLRSSPAGPPSRDPHPGGAPGLAPPSPAHLQVSGAWIPWGRGPLGLLAFSSTSVAAEWGVKRRERKERGCSEGCPSPSNPLSRQK